MNDITDEQRDLVERIRANMTRGAEQRLEAARRRWDGTVSRCALAARHAMQTGATFLAAADAFGVTANAVSAAFRRSYPNESTKGRWRK